MQRIDSWTSAIAGGIGNAFSRTAIAGLSANLIKIALQLVR